MACWDVFLKINHKSIAWSLTFQMAGLLFQSEIYFILLNISGIFCLILLPTTSSSSRLLLCMIPHSQRDLVHDPRTICFPLDLHCSTWDMLTLTSYMPQQRAIWLVADLTVYLYSKPPIFSDSHTTKKGLSYILCTVLRMCSFTLSPLLTKLPPLISSSLLAKITGKFLSCLWILTPPWKSDSLMTPTHALFYSWRCFLFFSISDCKIPKVRDCNLFINATGWQHSLLWYGL